MRYDQAPSMMRSPQTMGASIIGGHRVRWRPVFGICAGHFERQAIRSSLATSKPRRSLNNAGPSPSNVGSIIPYERDDALFGFPPQSGHLIGRNDPIMQPRFARGQRRPHQQVKRACDRTRRTRVPLLKSPLENASPPSGANGTINVLSSRVNRPRAALAIGRPPIGTDGLVLP